MRPPVFRAAWLAAMAFGSSAVGQEPAPAVAFVRGGDVWVRAVSGTQALRLTFDGRNTSPAWSHSGGWVAFLKGGQPWVVRRDGKGAARLATTSDARLNLRWSPVEDALAVGGAGVFRVNASGEWEQLRLPPIGGNPVWSPDGQRLVDDSMAVTDVAAARRGAALVPNPPGPLIPAAWAGGGYVLYWAAPEVSASILADGLPLFSVALPGGTPKKTAAVSLLARDFVAVSPDGSRAVVVDGCCRESWQDKAIALVDMASGAATRLTMADLAALSPDWSPDGRQIAFVASHDYAPEVSAKPHRGVDPRGRPFTIPAGKRVGVPFDRAQATPRGRRIWVMHSDGGGQAELTHDSRFRDERPRWTSDGRHIVFARIDEIGGVSLWWMDPDGAGLSMIADGVSPPPGTRPEYYGRMRWELLFDWHN